MDLKANHVCGRMPGGSVCMQTAQESFSITGQMGWRFTNVPVSSGPIVKDTLKWGFRECKEHCQNTAGWLASVNTSRFQKAHYVCIFSPGETPVSIGWDFTARKHLLSSGCYLNDLIWYADITFLALSGFLSFCLSTVLTYPVIEKSSLRRKFASKNSGLDWI